MSARVYFMERVKDCKDVSIMSPQDAELEDGQVYSVCMLQISCTTVLSKHKQKKINIADEPLTDYSFLSRYHYTKSKNYLKRRYRIRH